MRMLLITLQRSPLPDNAQAQTAGPLAGGGPGRGNSSTAALADAAPDAKRRREEVLAYAEDSLVGSSGA